MERRKRGRIWLVIPGTDLTHGSEAKTNAVVKPGIKHNLVNCNQWSRETPISTFIPFPPCFPTLLLRFINYLRQGKGRCPGPPLLINLISPWLLKISQILYQSKQTKQFPRFSHSFLQTFPMFPLTQPPLPAQHTGVTVLLKQTLALSPKPGIIEIVSKKIMYIPI